MELDEALEQWYHEVVKEVNLTVEEQAQITNAGAKVFEKKLYDVTPVSNNESKHARDSILSQAKDIDGDVNGKSTVGYGDKAYIMRFMNDGTKFYPKKGSGNNHLGFYNKLIDSPKVQAEVLAAEANVLKEIMKGKNKDE